MDTEDGKKDTLVDVVFKKALKEFRVNIFNSYSTALAVWDARAVFRDAAINPLTPTVSPAIQSR